MCGVSSEEQHQKIIESYKTISFKLFFYFPQVGKFVLTPINVTINN